jgi:sodium/proline symporter
MSVGLSLTFGLYVLLLVAIGVYFFLRTETKHLADYMLAGRNVGTWPIAISEVASVASGWTFFAWVGVGFTTGLNGLWFSLAMLVVVLFLYRYVAPTFRQQSAGDDLRHHRVRVRRTRRHTRPPPSPSSCFGQKQPARAS